MTGVDTEDRKPESIVNLTGLNPSWLLAIAFAALIAGMSQLMVPVLSTGSRLPGALLLAAIACGYVYQGPPFRNILQLSCAIAV
jgi:1,4-dihydroxy-2-naphthoate octaprenyltransferase